MIKDFINLVDNSESKFKTGLDLENKYLFYGIEKSNPNSYSSRELLEGIYLKIENCLKSDSKDSIGRNELLKLRSYFVIKYYYSKESLFPYYYVIEKLIEFTRADIRFKPLSEPQSWQMAIELLRGMLEIGGVNHGLPIQEDLNLTESDEDNETNEQYIFRTSYNKEKQIAIAALFFKEKGYNLIFDINGLRLDNSSKLKWIKLLKGYFEKTGGESVIYSIFEHLKSSYDNCLNRYLVHRQIGKISSETYPAVPYGYILNLAVQFIGQNESCENKEEIFNSIFEECKKYATLEGVQPYEFFDGMLYNNYNVIDNITESVLYDSIYLFPQLNYSYLPSILSSTFKWIDKEAFKNYYGFTLEDYIETSNCLLSATIQSNLKFGLNSFPLKKASIGKILDALSHLSNEVNVNFNFPEDYSLVNFNKKPLIKTGEFYYLADKNFCASSFIDCLAHLCSTLYNPKEYWSKLGFAVEETIKDKLQSKGIAFKSGKYRFNNIDFECDFVIEDSETVVFIETKNKTLTAKAKSGSSLDILSDLLYSIVSEMKQTGRHKVVLEKQGIIQLENNQEIKLEGREIERVGISFDEYGFIQSRMALLEFLRNISTIKVEISDKIASKIKNNIENILKDFQDNLQDIFKHDPEYDRKVFFDCWFFSLPMLFLMIDNSNSSESLIKEIKTLKYIGFNSHDYYAEYKHVKNNFSN